MKFINKMRKKEKGFTLVEIIVVLVILAILAAFTIPTMLGFVNDAKSKAHIAEAREVYVAAQSVATEKFAKNGTVATLDGSTDANGVVAASTDKALATLLGTDLTQATWTVVNTAGKVTSVTYTPLNGKSIIIAGGTTTIS